jgi:hypothetical protein
MNENQAASEADRIVFVTEPSQVLQDAILESKRSRHESDLDDCHDAGAIWSILANQVVGHENLLGTPLSRLS